MTLAQRLVAAARHARCSYEHGRAEDEIVNRAFVAHMDHAVHARHACLAFNHRSIARAIICACNSPWAVYRLSALAVDVDGRMPPELRAAIYAEGGRVVSLSGLDHQIQA